MSDRSQVHFTVDTDAKELAKDKLDHGELSQHLRQAVREIAFGEDVSKRSKLEDRLDALRDRRDELQSEQERIAADLEEVDKKITRIESRLDELDSRQDEYEGALEMLEDQLMGGTHIDPGHAQVKKAAHIGEKDPEDVITDLKERNPSVPEYAFVEYRQAKNEFGETWGGATDGAVADGGVSR